jgi:hypothetical protein
MTNYISPDLLLPDYGVFIDGPIIDEAVACQRETFVGQTDGSPYDEVFEFSGELLAGGSDNARFAPATHYIVETVLQILDDQRIEPMLPAEIHSRYDVASDIGKLVALNAVKNTDFIQAYLAKMPKKFHTIQNRFLLSKNEMLDRLAAAVFLDTQTVAGGASQFLKDENVSVAEHAVIIAGSPKLQVISKLDGDKLEKLSKDLGNGTYFYAQNFVFEQRSNGDRRRITFTQKALERILEDIVSSDGRCPMTKIGAKNERGTVFQSYLRRVVEYLVPDYSKTDKYEEPELAVV